ncbi:MAG: hypothetical protein ACXVHC_03230 [Frankiaceae bacterium]|jgi:hypothetical protein
MIETSGSVIPSRQGTAMLEGSGVSPANPFVIENLDTFDPDVVFLDGRDQVVVAVRITPVFGQIDLDLLCAVIDIANEREFALARESPFRDEWMLCVFEAFEED